MVKSPQPIKSPQPLAKKCIISRTIGFLCLTPSLQNLCDLIEKYRTLKKQEAKTHVQLTQELHQTTPTGVIVPGFMEMTAASSSVHSSVHSSVQSSATSLLLFYNLKRFFTWIYEYIFHTRRTHNHST